MKQIFILISAILMSACATPRTTPLTSIAGQTIVRAEVLFFEPATFTYKTCAVIENADALRFITEQLGSLQARRYDHSSPEFNLALKTTEGRSLILRISRHEVGPNAPASAWNVHWFPPPAAQSAPGKFPLYSFLRARAQEQCVLPAPRH